MQVKNYQPGQFLIQVPVSVNRISYKLQVASYKLQDTRYKVLGDAVSKLIILSMEELCYNEN